MLNSNLTIRKILLPVDFPDTALPVIHQAATLAHQFHSEITMLHVATPQSHAAGVPVDGPALAAWDILAEVINEAGKKLDETLAPELDGLTIRRTVVDGDAAQVIMRAAQEVDLVMMPSRGQTFDRFLLGSTVGEAQHGTDCPIWTSALVEELPAQPFAIRNILCAVYFNPHDRKTLSWAAQIVAEFGARLTIAHVTAGVDFWGPGGNYVNPKWKEALVSDANEQIADLQKKVGTKAEVFIGSGIAPKVLSLAARQTNADLLVNACQPYGTNLRTHGYAIICAVPIPVVSV